MQKENLIPKQLSDNSIFEGLTPAQIESILPCIALSIKDYGKQECVCDKGEEIDGLGVVLDGSLCECDEGYAGRNLPVSHIDKNGVFGESALFSSTSRVPHRLIARNGAQVLYLSGDFFLCQCGNSDCSHREAHQAVVGNMLRLLSDRALMLNKKITYLTANDLKTKIAMYLCELYEVNQSETFHMPLNRDRLAEFFAVARPSLSRELINLKSASVIDFHRSNVTILDLDALYRLAHGD